MSLPTGQITMGQIFQAFNAIYFTQTKAMSELRGGPFTDGTSVPTSGPVVMSLFRGKTFGSGGTESSF